LKSFDEAYAEHEEIFKLIKKKDVDKTLAAIERNITIAVDHSDFESDVDEK